MANGGLQTTKRRIRLLDTTGKARGRHGAVVDLLSHAASSCRVLAVCWAPHHRLGLGEEKDGPWVTGSPWQGADSRPDTHRRSAGTGAEGR